MCISMFAGEAKRDALISRKKGRAVGIEKLKEEVRMKEGKSWIAVHWLVPCLICILVAIGGWISSQYG